MRLGGERGPAASLASSRSTPSDMAEPLRGTSEEIDLLKAALCACPMVLMLLGRPSPSSLASFVRLKRRPWIISPPAMERRRSLRRFFGSE